MAHPKLQQIPIDQIRIDDRLRALDDEQARMLAYSMDQVELPNPITVRPTPAAEKGRLPFTLVMGAHRLRACQLRGDEVVSAFVVKADRETAGLMEICENLFRNDLSMLERAEFVERYRIWWESKNGSINSKGGRPKKLGQNDPVFGLGRDTEKRPKDLLISGIGFAAHVADRLGLSKVAVKRMHVISSRLLPVLKELFRATSVADNQSQLLQCARLSVEEQARFAVGFKATGDFEATMALLSPDRPELPRIEKERIALLDKWSRWSKADRAAILSALPKHELFAALGIDLAQNGI